MLFPYYFYCFKGAQHAFHGAAQIMRGRCRRCCWGCRATLKPVESVAWRKDTESIFWPKKTSHSWIWFVFPGYGRLRSKARSCNLYKQWTKESNWTQCFKLYSDKASGVLRDAKLIWLAQQPKFGWWIHCTSYTGYQHAFFRRKNIGHRW